MKKLPPHVRRPVLSLVLVGAVLTLTACSSMFREPTDQQRRETEIAQRANQASPDLITRNQEAQERTQEFAQKNK